jgi:DNA repair/transcription protein MET18/MMS19
MTNASEAKTTDEVYADFLLITLFVVRHLYRKATVNASEGDQNLVSLSEDFSQRGIPSESQYLHLISDLAGFAVHELNDSQQLILKAEGWAVSLFQEEFAATSSWTWLVQGRVNVLAFGVIEALRPASVARLVSIS